LVTADGLKPVSTFLQATFAWTTAAAEGSTTVPVSTAVDCAQASAGASRIVNRARRCISFPIKYQVSGIHRITLNRKKKRIPLNPIDI
jgi:hypothetical protein